MAATKTSRDYRSPLREEQAANTRQRILDAAAGCFAEAGFAGTSLRDIAVAAGVSVETVKLNGPKSALLIGAFEQAFSGNESHENIVDSEAGRAALGIADNDEFLSTMVRFIADANARTSPLWAAFTAAAASDPVAKFEMDDLLSRKLQDCRTAIAEFDRRDMITTDSPRNRLADVLSFVISAEGHQQLVTQAGWSHARYTAWMEASVRQLVLSPTDS